MNKDEAIAALKQLVEGSDFESAHCQADEILLEFLRANGGQDVADEYERLRKHHMFYYA
jgi:hypothetical protein